MRNKFLLTLLLWLTLLGSTWAQNNALHFDGTDDYVSSPYFTATSFTAEVWVKPDRLNTDQAIISTLSTAANTGFELHIKEDAMPVFTIRHGSNWKDLSANRTVSAGQWLHLAASYDDATKKMTIYLNGSLCYSLILPSASIFYPGGEAMYFGRRSSGDLFFNGAVDEVRLWSTVRTHTEIVQSLNATFAGNESGLERYYKFNQGTADADNSSVTSLADSTAYAINGTLVNFGLSGSASNWVEGFNTNDLQYDLSASQAEVSIERASSSTANFTISSNTSWTIANNTDWLDLNSTSGMGYASITLTANETNTSDNTRTAQLVISGTNVENDTVTVIQQHGQIQVNNSNVSLNSASGSTTTVNITSNTEWSIAESADWLSVSPVSGTGNETITLTTESVNDEDSPRTTELVISGTNAESKTVTVTQSVATITLSRTTMEIDAEENSWANFSITTDVNWNASSTVSWLSMNTTSGTGNARIIVTAEALPEGVTQRYGTILLSGSFNPAVITVTQSALPNNALDFDGGDDFVMLPTFGADVNFSQGFTYTAWIQWKAFNNWSKLLDFGNGAGNYNITFGNEG
ncbi:MAG: BACON domain-containing carbohydrate-binding protein, partial [Salinivirgaceae bacterium]|nr:BACON domain-containing carbohydrate-binding protein [Salinivirgaceae bacterium]